ncbi:hypothetical protein [Streptomyces ehimensis]|uniref:Uncharacterized protein n=1 Tax=Streptomyces ehimensis TaxID=68195 RepID=A0ABV9BV26_9ACTN
MADGVDDPGGVQGLMPEGNGVVGVAELGVREGEVDAGDGPGWGTGTTSSTRSNGTDCTSRCTPTPPRSWSPAVPRSTHRRADLAADPVLRARVCNLLGPDRIHLIADVYADDAYPHLAKQCELAPSSAETLPPASQAMLADQLAGARRLADLGYVDAAEQLLLRLFYSFALPEGAGYDLIADLHTALGDAEAAVRWTAARDKILARTTS